MKTMKTVSFMLLAIISCITADSKCKLMNTEDGCVVYQCIQATLDDVNNIPDEAEWIRFIVSKLSDIPEKAFARFTLRGLSFYNCELRNINSNAFDGLEKLQQLIFYGSNIHVLKGSWFKNMSSLTHLFLDQNNMLYIEPYVFSLIPNLEYLNIEDNDLNCLTKHDLMPLTKLKHVRIDKNPWLCSCHTELIGWIKNQRIDYGAQNITETGLECMAEYDTQPSGFKKELETTNENSSAPRTEYFSMSSTESVLFVGNNISVLSQIPNTVKSIKFLNSQLPKIPRFAFFRFGNSLRSLDFSNCSVSDIHPEAFAGLSKLENLILFNNSINLVIAEWFRDLRGLKHLAMDGNGIEHIQSNVFPLLDKLETLSINKNDIGCFPIQGFASMKHLKYMTIANNTWICSCLEDFREWLHQNEANYSVLPTQCTDNKMHMIGREYISGYRNVRFQQDFENEDKKIINENAKLVPGGTLQGVKPFDSTPIAIPTSANNSVRIIKEEAHHNRNKEIANYEYYRLLSEHERNYRSSGNVLRAKYDGFERTAMLKIPSGYINFDNNQLAQISNNNTDEKSSVEPSLSDSKQSYTSVGGTIWNIARIPPDAEAIIFERSVVPKIIRDIFVCHVKLRVLKFVNCGVREIEPQAFTELVKLRELILDDNDINVVRTVWFEDTPNLERLSLLRNSITRIENGVFQFLPNLKHFGISNNQLNCIGLDGLTHLKKLYSVDVGNNPWSCLCQMKLKQWLIKNEIRYDADTFERRADWDCIEEYQSSKMTNNKHQNKTSADNRKFDVDFEVQESAIIQTTENTQDTERIEETKHVMENTQNIQTEENKDLDSTVTGPRQIFPISGHCRFDVSEQSGDSRWWCNGEISVLDQIPTSAENIVIFNISVIPANSFARFSNLIRLLFYDNSIREVDPLAFATLNELEWLEFLKNSLPTIRSSWFHDLANVTLLRLERNSISEIEPDVFEYLPNLEELFIEENNLRCIYTKSLSPLKKLKRVKMQNNPWKWRCREELIQFFEAHRISYESSYCYTEKRIIADLLPNYNSE